MLQGLRSFLAKLLRAKHWVTVGIYFFLLLLLSRYTEGSFFPHSDLGILWFFSGLLSLLLSAFISEKHYTSISTAVSNSVAGIGAMYALITLSSNSLIGGAVVPSFILGILLFALLLSISLNFRNSHADRRKVAKIVGKIADGKILFSVVFFLAIVSLTFKTNTYTTNEFLLCVGYFVCVFLFDPIGMVLGLFSEKLGDEYEIVYWLNPAMVIVESKEEILIGEVFHADGCEWKVIQAFRVPEKYQAKAIKENIEANTIGILSKGSDTDHCLIDLIGNVEEKQIIETPLARGVYFQVVKLELVEEKLESGNKIEFIRAHAVRVYEARSAQKFKPSPGTTFTSLPAREFTYQPQNLFWLCGTSVTLDLADINEKKFVTHNATIIGSVGAGKTSLAFMIEKALAEKGVKIVCLDETKQHLKYLKSKFRDAVVDITDELNATKNSEAMKLKFEELLNTHFQIDTPDQATTKILFVDPTGVEDISYSPEDKAQITDGGNWNPGKVGPAGIAAYITRTLYYRLRAFSKSHGGDTAGLYLVVYEEASHLIPEIKSDRQQNVNHSKETAKCIMQGRKYGFGSLVLTQRTATVSKDVLYNCNTVFSKKMNDERGVEYLGFHMRKSDYEHLIKFLEPKEVLCFGLGLPLNQPAVLQFENQHEPEARTPIIEVAAPEETVELSSATEFEPAGEESPDVF